MLNKEEKLLRLIDEDIEFYQAALKINLKESNKYELKGKFFRRGVALEKVFNDLKALKKLLESENDKTT